MKEKERKYLVQNRHAFHLYEIGERYEAGISLKGTEVKSLRMGMGNLRDGYILLDDAGEAWVKEMVIPPYPFGNLQNG